jgi:hypothetical protein
MLHEKANGVSALSAAKAFVDFFGRRNCEGRGFLVVERTVPQVVGAPLFQLHETADYLNDINAVLNLLYGVLRNQGNPNVLQK